jgi:hypothetical protein
VRQTDGRSLGSGAPIQAGERERGSEPVEATLTLVPLLFMTFPMLDMSLVIFLRFTMQEVVREGTRYAITPHNINAPNPASVVYPIRYNRAYRSGGILPTPFRNRVPRWVISPCKPMSQSVPRESAQQDTELAPSEAFEYGSPNPRPVHPVD